MAEIKIITVNDRQKTILAYLQHLQQYGWRSLGHEQSR